MSLLLANAPEADEARRQAWLAKRRTLITSTDVPILFGCGYEGWSVARLFADKMGTAPIFEPNERMMLGRFMQPVIARLYEERTGLQVVNADQYTVFVSEEHPWLGTSLDAFDSEGRIVEIKNTGQYIPDDLGAVDTGWLMQTQVEMIVTKKPVRLVVLSQGVHLRIFDCTPNPEFVQEMLRRGKEFWDAVQAKTCPPPSSGDDSDGLKYVFADPRDGETVQLDESYGALVADRDGLSKQIDELTGRKKLIDAELKYALGNATVGILEGGRRITWRPDKNGRRNLRCGEEAT